MLRWFKSRCFIDSEVKAGDISLNTFSKSVNSCGHVLIISFVSCQAVKRAIQKFNKNKKEMLFTAVHKCEYKRC